MKLLLIAGGEGLSSESEVSLKSAHNVTKLLSAENISADTFIVNADNINEIADRVTKYDLVYPLIHGQFGEDGQLQLILEEAGIHFLGSGSSASKLCFDKQACKLRLIENKIKVPAGVVLFQLDQAATIQLPAFIKPVSSGSGLGILKVPELDDGTIANIQEVLKQHGPLLAEELIEGTEISVGILGDIALPVVEIIPPDGELFHFENRYSGKTLELIPPTSISESLQAEAQEIALKAHQACGCHHFSRVDMLIRNNEIFVLEINTIPGMSSESIYPRELVAANLTIQDLITQIG